MERKLVQRHHYLGIFELIDSPLADQIVDAPVLQNEFVLLHVVEILHHLEQRWCRYWQCFVVVIVDVVVIIISC